MKLNWLIFIIIIINFVKDRVIQKAGPVNVLPYTQTYSTYNYNSIYKTNKLHMQSYAHKNHTIIKK